MNGPSIGTSRWHWFLRGLLMGILFVAALNAISYFFRSGGWGSLLGGAPTVEAIGMPVEFWQGHCQSAALVRGDAMMINVAVGLLVGVICGLVTMTQMARLNQMIENFEQSSEGTSYRPFQFSVGNIMVATVPIAILFAAARTGRVEVLGAIYLLGPLSLVILAMLPRGLSWDWRVIILMPMAVSLIGFAVWIAAQASIDFEKVMLGIFVCWVPQSALAAIILTLGILAGEYRRQRRSEAIT